MPRPLIIAVALALAYPARAQVALHLTGTVGVTDFRPAPLGVAATQVGLEQVMGRLVVRSRNGRWRAWLALNGEGLTMPDGVLNLGGFGEGYADRRHPHTYVHEAAVGVVQPVGSARLSLTAGKGFAAFGTDDPMSRPALKYPVNHHWAQIVERWVLIGAVAAGPVTLEGTVFDGDEPERPWQWPSLARFGDSWTVRATVRPLRGLEMQASRAIVVSPEHRGGAGPDARKWSASASSGLPFGGGTLRGLAEWARTDEAGRPYYSQLGEVEWAMGAARPYVRLEHTDRPEEERRLDPFLTVRPHLDDHVLGVTRWTILTAGYGHRLHLGAVVVEPLVEASVARVREIAGGLFDPRLFYGGDTLRQLTVAVRMHWGTAGMMGRYGVQDGEGMGGHHHD